MYCSTYCTIGCELLAASKCTKYQGIHYCQAHRYCQSSESSWKNVKGFDNVG